MDEDGKFWAIFWGMIFGTIIIIIVISTNVHLKALKAQPKLSDPSAQCIREFGRLSWGNSDAKSRAFTSLINYLETQTNNISIREIKQYMEDLDIVDTSVKKEVKEDTCGW